ncbi:MAG: phage portal protein [Planctomycetota bacterium]|nr:phage portal protein [Planctomycetota bacterium]MDA1211792.1 phage portal protein [Planctomycetota bacterium]
MLTYLRDTFATVRLRARYQRKLQEQLLGMVESTGRRPPLEESTRWWPLGGTASTSSAANGVSQVERDELRHYARQLVAENPYARNALRLLEIYVAGPGLRLGLTSRCDDPGTQELCRTAERLWGLFLRHNHRHFSYREFARRTWRDGECFLRKFPQPTWPPCVRFVDPEQIGPTREEPDHDGIRTLELDEETPLAYLSRDPASLELWEVIPAELMFHTRIGADSNQQRGVSVFSSIIAALRTYDGWLATELQARKLQASIVLWRKVQGAPSQVSAYADTLANDGSTDGVSRKERVKPGTIVTTSSGTDLKFLQPDTNFSDAVPLGRILLLALAAGFGLPEFMLTSDAANANFSSTLVAEGPAVKLFQSEQEFFAVEFGAIWEWAMREAIAMRLLPDDFFERVEMKWTFPQVVNRDRPQERLADVKLVEARILSRAEVARRDGVDPAAMQSELNGEG